ncbi:type IV prepilin [Robbsia andropogonis]|uniref:Type IV prepilin n=2 Tax=Robbsia andropogonis TaxID=28092 RepID=A0A0F5JZP1_9BURK|nr:type IV prepilin [Robbsia andropogonis]
MAQAYGVTALSSVRTRTPTSGFALVELLAALAILGLLLAGVASMINTSLQDAKGQQTASYQAALATAAAKVVANNASALLDSATATTPVVIGLTTATNPSYALSTYLPDGIGTRNAYGQTPCLLVYANAAHTMLQGLLVTEGGVSISDDALGYIAGNAGQGGGSIPATNNASGAALGAFGTWSVATPNPSGKSCSGTVTGVGHLVNEVTTNATNAQDADFLYRVAVPGDPTANAMQVPLILAKETLGAACTAATGAIAADDQNHVLSCVAGTWQPVPLLHWRDPVVNATDLSAMTNPQTGDVAMTTATGRAYTFNGASWQALAVDENGVLALGNQETVGAACAATQASTTPVSTDAKGRVLSCQNGTWQTQSEVLPALNVVGCETIMSSPGATDYTCTTVPNAWTINTTNNTYTTIHTETVTLNKAGMISASSWAHMNDGVCEGNGVMGTGHNAQESQSLDVFDSSGNTLSHTESMGPTLKDDSGGINNTLNTAQNAGTYTVQVTTNWATYAGITTPWTSSYCDTAGNPISNSPLVAGWSVNTYY